VHVRALYSGFSRREQDALRLLRKGGIPDAAPIDASGKASEVISPQELKKELAEFKESLMVTENMLALFVTTHSAVSVEDAKIILEVRELMEHTKLLISM
jgi:hypothetical protein